MILNRSLWFLDAPKFKAISDNMGFSNFIGRHTQPNQFGAIYQSNLIYLIINSSIFPFKWVCQTRIYFYKPVLTYMVRKYIINQCRKIPRIFTKVSCLYGGLVNFRIYFVNTACLPRLFDRLTMSAYVPITELCRKWTTLLFRLMCGPLYTFHSSVLGFRRPWYVFFLY